MVAPAGWPRFVDNSNKRAKKYGVEGRLSWRMQPVDGPCRYCGSVADSWDHVVPLIKGGSNDLTNIVPCCLPCNRRKSHLSVAEFLSPTVSVRCGWCQKSLVRSRKAVREAATKGRSYFVCSTACAGRMSASLPHPLLDNPSQHTLYMRGWNRRRAEKKLAAGF